MYLNLSVAINIEPPTYKSDSSCMKYDVVRLLSV